MRRDFDALYLRNYVRGAENYGGRMGRTGGADAGARLPSVLHANDIRYGRHDAELASVEEQRQPRRQVMA